MTNPRTSARYGSISILLHWLMLALLVAVYLTAELQEDRDGAAVFKAWHYTLGLSVFALVWVRIVARLIWPAPPAVGEGWRPALAKVTHGLLYVLMIGMPLIGWLILSAEGEAIALFGLHLPSLTAADHGLAERMEEVHEVGSTLGYGIVGLHAVAALFHHYVLRDGLMARMLPGGA